MSRAAAYAAPVLAALLALLAVFPAASQPVDEGDSVGTHVVREGETLRAITERYLGSDELWRENWKLNPEITDPNLILPGQRIRVIVSRRLPPRSAEVVDLGGRVDAKPDPQDWIPASRGDLLAERDGLRTFRRSSAELRFDDEARLQLSEESLVFLRRYGTRLTGEFEETVEVVEGQADLELRPNPRRAEMEVVVGDATARPRTTGGSAESRVRRTETSGQLMVYRGASEVEAAGRAVSVAQGMGTTVPDGEPPTPPERLLPAPRPLAPAAGSRHGFANPRFAWRPVEGAAHYRVEVCRDPACAVLVERSAPLTASAWTPPELPVADLHWRVTASAPSGLDGYPSASAAFAIADPRPDEEPPVVAFVARGAARAEGPELLVAGAGGGVLPAVHDDVAGVATVELRWDGGAWRPWDGAALTPPAGGGVLEVRAEDGAGRVTERRLEVRPAEAPPAPPEVRP